MDDYELIDENIPNTDMEHKSATSGSSWKTWFTQKAVLTLDKYSRTKSTSSFNNSGTMTPQEFSQALENEQANE